MHICVVSPDYPTSKTIDFVFVDQLCRALASRGEKVTVIAPQTLTKCLVRHVPIAKFKHEIKLANGKSFTLLRPKYASAGVIGLKLSWLLGGGYTKAVERAFKTIKEPIDVCYGHFWQSVKAVYPLAKHKNIPLIASSGEEQVTQARIGYTEDDIESIGNYLSGVISVSTNNRDECAAIGLIDEKKSCVIPNAIDNNLFYPRDKQECHHRLGINKDDFLVAYVGQFTERKGTLRLDNALKKINDNSIKAFFIGKGPEDPTYDGIIYKGQAPHHLLPEYLSAADVFVLPTRNEGCCNAIIEALACGLPVISSNRAFNWDVLDETNSVLIDPDDETQVADAIRTLKENPGYKKRLSEGALQKAQSLTLKQRAEKIVTFIEEQINKES